MQAHPALARLRSTPAPQPRTDAALAAWRAAPEVAAILAALSDYGAGASLAALPDLARVVADHTAAQALTDGLIAPLLAALRDEPLAQLPLGHSATPGLARLRLARAGRAALTLTAFARQAAVLPTSGLFEDGEAHEIVLAGAGRALCHQLTGGRLHSDRLVCTPGTRLARGGADETRQFVEVTRPLLVLQLTRTAENPAPSREMALADGALLKTISGCKQTSQQMMALGVLGALQHRPAAAVMAQLALDRGAARDLRWEALRQVLALDSARGMAVLARLTDGHGDELAAPAAALHRDLVAAHPQLVELEPA